jgi:hypothetical protein
MAVSGDSKTCPRCNTLLPAAAAFCGNCGYQFAGSADSASQETPPISGEDTPTLPDRSNAAFTPDEPVTLYGGLGTSAGEQQQASSQPIYQAGDEPQNQPDYPPPPPPVYPSYPMATGAVTPRRGGVGKWIAAALALVIVVAGGTAAWFLYLSPSRCSGPLFDRHGLQSNVPLPNNCSYMNKRTFVSAPSAIPQVTADEWFWTVDKPGDVNAIQQFYDSHLASNGWVEKHPSALSSSDPTAKAIYACQGNQALFIEAAPKIPITTSEGRIDFTLQGPPGGSALAMAITSSPSFLKTVCSG